MSMPITSLLVSGAGEGTGISNFSSTSLTAPIPGGFIASAVHHAVPSNVNVSAISSEAIAQFVSNASIPEFLYQLTRILTEDHHDIIEWSNGKIEVHNPHRLEQEVLNKFFRHSKYASFQRQLNYFGFRKLAGKGKMAPCSYINEHTTSDLRSLLKMKRKTSATAKETDKNKHSDLNGKTDNGINVSKSPRNKGVKRSRDSIHNVESSPTHTSNSRTHQQHHVHPLLPGTGAVSTSAVPIQDNKRSAHHFTFQSKDPTTTSIATTCTVNVNANNNNNNGTSNTVSANSSFNSLDGFKQHATSGNKIIFLDPSQLGMGIEDIADSSAVGSQDDYYPNHTMSILHGDGNGSDENYQNYIDGNGILSSSSSNMSGFRQMKRDSSLVALAMIPSLLSMEPTPFSEVKNEDKKEVVGMTSFIDFSGSEQLVFDPSIFS